MIRAILLAAVLLVTCGATSPAGSRDGVPVFAVVMTRHGVRSFTHTPPEYIWPDWSPVAPGYLSAHGYTLVTYLGPYYRAYFGSIGLPMDCA